MTKSIHIRSAPLGAIRAFEAAARLGSFKLAANELSVTPAAISHQISSLEDYLGVPLFVRSNRLVQLSDAGRALSQQVSAAFIQLQDALLKASATALDQNVLVVSAAPSIAAKWLVPRLSRFHARHPDIDLRLSSENQTHDLIKDPSIDVVLRYGKGGYDANTGLQVEKLWEETYLFPVCSPNTLGAKRIPLKKPIDLLSHTLLRLPLPPDRQTGEVGERWQAWFEQLALDKSISESDQKTLQKHARKGPFYSHEHLAIDTAKSGHGVCLALDVLVIEDLLAQQLIRPVAVRCRDPFSHWMICRQQDAQSHKLMAFANWIRDEAATSLQTLASCRFQGLS